MGVLRNQIDRGLCLDCQGTGIIIQANEKEKPTVSPSKVCI